MARKKTPVNTKTPVRLTEIINNECDGNNSKFCRELSYRTNGEVNLSRETISQIKHANKPLTERVAIGINKAFPNYSVEWLMGKSDRVSGSDEFWLQSELFDYIEIHFKKAIYGAVALLKLNQGEVIAYSELLKKSISGDGVPGLESADCEKDDWEKQLFEYFPLSQKDLSILKEAYQVSGDFFQQFLYRLYIEYFYINNK